MADGQSAGQLQPPRWPLNIQDFPHLRAWGLAAAAALVFAMVAILSEAGISRLASALTGSHSQPEPLAGQTAASDDGEIRRMAEVVQRLVADRGHLLARIGTLERSLEDVTGSIAKQAQVQAKSPETRPAEKPLAQIVAALATPPAAAPPQPAPRIAPAASRPAPAPPRAVAPPPSPPSPAPVTTASLPPSFTAPGIAFIPSSLAEPAPAGDAWAKVSLPQVPSSQEPESQVAPEQAAADAAKGKKQYGIDLGVAPNLNGVRALWTAAKNRHGPALEGMHPIVVMRESTRPGGMEFRLVVGPLRSAGAAVRLCASIAAFSSTCRPALFDGQRLAAR